MNYLNSEAHYDLNRDYRNRQEEEANKMQQVQKLNHGTNGYPRTVVRVLLVGLIILLSVQTSFARMIVQDSIAGTDENWEQIFRALTAFESEDYELALTELDSLLNIDTELVDAYLLASHIYLIQGDAESAFLLGKIAYTIDPGNGSAYFFVGEAYCELEHYEDAQDHYQAYRNHHEADGFRDSLILSLLNIDTLAVLDEQPLACTQPPIS